MIKKPMSASWNLSIVCLCHASLMESSLQSMEAFPRIYKLWTIFAIFIASRSRQNKVCSVISSERTQLKGKMVSWKHFSHITTHEAALIFTEWTRVTTFWVTMNCCQWSERMKLNWTGTRCTAGMGRRNFQLWSLFSARQTIVMCTIIKAQS